MPMKLISPHEIRATVISKVKNPQPPTTSPTATDSPRPGPDSSRAAVGLGRPENWKRVPQRFPASAYG